jgi:dienelactone hydrolase
MGFRMNRLVFVLIAASLLTACRGGVPPEQPIEGLYERADGKTLVISGRDKETLRYRILETGGSGALWQDGNAWVSGRGWAVREPVSIRIEAAAGIKPETVTFAEEGRPQQAKRLPLTERFAYFAGTSGNLYAKLTTPPAPGPHPLVVIVHGSESSSAVRGYPYDKLFARRGLATLIFDKRGTGKSEGTYTQDFSALADDVNAAVEWARAQQVIDPARIALAGYSQGGWIAPLAASRNPNVRAVLVGYGLLMSPFDEEMAQAVAPIVSPKFTAQDRVEAEEFVRAAQPMMKSGFRDGFDAYGAVHEKYKERAWMKALGEGVIKEIAGYPVWMLRVGGRFYDKQTSWEYDGQAAMQKLAIPMFWQIAEKDDEAPPELTLKRLAALREGGKPVTVKVYPGTDHGLLTFVEKDGKRVLQQYHPEALSDMVDWLAKVLEPASK